MRDVNAKSVIVMLGDGTIMKGKTNIGNARRVSDYFNKPDNLFLVFFDVSLPGQESGVIFVNRNNIVWVRPDDEAPRQAAEDGLPLDIDAADGS